MSDVEYLNKLFADFDSELERVANAAANSDEQSSAVDNAAAAIYRLREKVKAGYPNKKAYYAAASAEPQGAVLEGITALYGKHAHDLVQDLAWLPVDHDTVISLLDDDQRSRYRAAAGHGVVETFRGAREYLWNATHSDNT